MLLLWSRMNGDTSILYQSNGPDCHPTVPSLHPAHEPRAKSASEISYVTNYLRSHTTRGSRIAAGSVEQRTAHRIRSIKTNPLTKIQLATRSTVFDPICRINFHHVYRLRA